MTTSKQHADTMRGVLQCALAWEPDARLIGNIRAGDIASASGAAIALLDPQPATDEGEREHCVSVAVEHSGHDAQDQEFWAWVDMLKRERAQAREQNNGGVKAVFAKEFQAELLERTVECDKLRAKLAAIEAMCSRHNGTVRVVIVEREHEDERDETIDAPYILVSRVREVLES